MLINDRLSTILTQYAGEMAFVQRSQDVFGEHRPCYAQCVNSLYARNPKSNTLNTLRHIPI